MLSICSVFDQSKMYKQRTALFTKVATLDGELQSKLKKWKESADNSEPVFSFDENSASKIPNSPSEKQDFPFGPRRKSSTSSSTRPALPPKSAFFRQKQLKKLLDGSLKPPPNKKFKERDIRGLLDLVTMQIKAENRVKGKVELFKNLKLK